MSVNADRIDTKPQVESEIRCFQPYPGKGEELLEGAWNFSMM
jgi:hypothetical protein